MTNELINIKPPQDVLVEYFNSGEEPSLTFKMGDFSSKGKPIALGTVFVAKSREHMIGLNIWIGGKPVKSFMGYLYEGYQPPDRPSLGYLDEDLWERDASGNPRDPVQSSESIPLIADDGTEYRFTTGTWGGHCSLVKLQKACRADGMRRDPVVKLGTAKVKNQYGGVNFRPVFAITDWIENTGGQTQPVLQLKAPKKSAAEIVDDEIPFNFGGMSTSDLIGSLATNSRDKGLKRTAT